MGYASCHEDNISRLVDNAHYLRDQIAESDSTDPHLLSYHSDLRKRCIPLLTWIEPLIEKDLSITTILSQLHQTEEELQEKASQLSKAQKSIDRLHQEIEMLENRLSDKTIEISQLRNQLAINRKPRKRICNTNEARWSADQQDKISTLQLETKKQNKKLIKLYKQLGNRDQRMFDVLSITKSIRHLIQEDKKISRVCSSRLIELLRDIDLTVTI